MKIKQLTINGNKRLALSGINKLVWNPQTSYQMILGTNGSGKSSLMAELSPLPPAPSDYFKGGGKIIEIDHNDTSFILESRFTTAGRHSFIMNDKELNEGGTSAVQKELVYKYFAYTKDLHDLLMGNIEFTEMPTGERRKWITKLSQNDYTYALGVFKAMKTALRDVKGHLKHIQRRLIDETAQYKQMSANGNLEAEVKQFHERLSKMLSLHDDSLISSDQAKQDLNNALRALESAGERILAITNTLPLVNHKRSLEALDELIGEQRRKLSVTDEILTRSHKEYASIERQVSHLIKVDTQNPEQLQQKEAKIKSQLESMSRTVDKFKDLLAIDDPFSLQDINDEILTRVMGLFSQLPDNSDKRFTKASVLANRQKKEETIKKKAKCESAIKVLEDRLHVINHASTMTCPRCEHAWTPGIQPGEEKQVKAKLDGYYGYLDKFKKAIEHCDSFMEEAENYMSLYRQWRGFVNQYPKLHLLWDYIQSNQYDLNQPGNHNDVFMTWQDEVSQVCQLKTLRQELANTQKAIETMVHGEGFHLKKRLSDLEKDIAVKTNEKSTILNELNKSQKQHDQLSTLVRMIDIWNETMGKLESSYDDAIASLANDYLKQDIQTTQGKLGSMQHALNNRNVLKGVLDGLNKDVESSQLDLEALEILVKELSPNEGLIAEQLKGFINCLVEQINSMIDPVWTYELEIQPCGMANGDLDYQFPLKCGADGPSPKDISQGSRSIKEIINFAFTQTAMLYMGMKDFPLYVDELGASFDEAHRPAIHQFIARLMESQRYSQTFLISHYTAGYGSFHDAQYLVLDDRNITVPSQYNDHVVME